MSVPPPPDPYGAQPPSAGGQPGGGGVPPQWGPQQGGPPGRYGGYGSPPQGQWPQPPQWQGGPGGPPPKGGKGKWILGGVAVVLAIALSVVVTILVTRPAGGGGGGNGDPTQPNGGSEFASANDTGPVNIITEDPTCEAWGRISRDITATQRSVSWGDRDRAIPASAWTPAQRNAYEAVGAKARQAAEQTSRITKSTPNRLMRELYEQYIAYANAFADSVENYIERDQYLSGAMDGFGSATSAICSAIERKSAPAMAPLLSPIAVSPGITFPASDRSEPERFIDLPNPACTEWATTVERFDQDTGAWKRTDPRIPATEWTPEVRSLSESTASVIVAFADNIESISRSSGNHVFEDIGFLSAQYSRAFAKAMPTFTISDFYLSQAGTYLSASINAACKAAE